MIESSPTAFSSSQIEKWSKQFYHYFKAERAAFLQHLATLSQSAKTQEYGALLLQRILVLYFLQSQGLLDHDYGYLSHHLDLQAKASTQNACSFYHQWLLPLCTVLYTGQLPDVHAHERFGYIPHLAHPLFQLHPEETGSQLLQIPDHAFVRLFAFLDTYSWQMSKPMQEQLLPTKQLTTHALAYIYEQHSDQKKTGTYYTHTDIALYIASQTIIPGLLTRVARDHPTAFIASAPIWQLLQKKPERYLPPALCTVDLLPKEDKREYQLRRIRYQQRVTQMQAGTFNTLSALTTENLDLQRFTLDMLAICEDPALLISIATHLEQLSILDPTCGSGAFLCASITVLQPLYTLCFQRLFENITFQRAAQEHATQVWGQHYQRLQQRIEQAPSQAYFILQLILSQNLYGVDLQTEAVELCTLRLYLMLLSEIQQIADVPAFTTIPLHIHVGNALTQHSTDTLDTDALDTGTQIQNFQWQTAFPEVYAHGGFAVILGNPPYLEYNKVKDTYVINGYEEKSCGNIYAAIIERSLELCHPEQSYLGLIVPISLCGSARFQGVRTRLLHTTDALWLANFEIFPCRLFEDAFQRLSILIARSARQQPSEQHQLFVTRIHRWYADERPHLLQLLSYTPVTRLNAQPTSRTAQVIFPKLASPLQERLLNKLGQCTGNARIADLLQREPGPFFIYYQEATNYWTKAVCHIPFYKKNGMVTRPAHGRFLYFAQEQHAHAIMALLNSSLFYLWFATYSDGFHLSHALVQNFPLAPELASSPQIAALAQQLEDDIARNIHISTRNTHTTPSGLGHHIELAEYHMRYSKHILDEIDHALAKLYGLSTIEENFIINYDLKHRIAKNRSNNL